MFYCSAQKKCVFYCSNTKIMKISSVVWPSTASVGGRHTRFTEPGMPFSCIRCSLLQVRPFKAPANNEDGARVDVSASASGFWGGNIRRHFLMSKCLIQVSSLYRHFEHEKQPRKQTTYEGNRDGFFYLNCIFNIKGWYGSCCCYTVQKTYFPCLSSTKELSYIVL